MFIHEGNDRLYVGCAAHVVQDAEELAWAETFVTKNPNYKWILGKYAEAENANRNRQFMTADDMANAQPTLEHAPLNINHTPLIVGHFVGSDILGVTEDQAAEGLHPHMEALSVYYKARFEDEYAKVEKAHRSNSLFYSMEARPERIHCGGDRGCGQEFAYIARHDPSYCTHLNNPNLGAQRDMLSPRFMGGALIIPPVRPGWGNATIEEISSFVKGRDEELHTMTVELAEEMPDADPTTWEMIAIQLASVVETESARDFTTKMRASLVKTGHAMPDGSFPIVTVRDLHNARQAIGRAEPAKREAVKAHIKSRAKALGVNLPETY